MSNLHVWLGLKNSDDQGTSFDLQAELYKNGALVTSGLTRCITGVIRDPNLAKEVTAAFAPFATPTFNGTSDQLSLKIWTRIGTNPDNTKCPGHNNAVGLRLYFDATTRSARFGTTFGAATSGPLTQARVSHTATLLADGKVLLAGGTGASGVLSSAELFDPVTLSATALSNTLTTPRTEHTATLLPQTETLLIAGQDSLGLLFSTEMFNPGTQTFRTLSPNVQVMRAGHTATGLLDGRVLITGGQNAGALSSVEGFNAQTVVIFKPAYDPEAGTFTLLPNGLVTPRWDHTATVLADGRVLITGGRNATGILTSAELFDPATEEFTALTGALA
ncbi:MAG: Kelch repeat-containing protein, partial [Gemmatimonadales bacterium]